MFLLRPAKDVDLPELLALAHHLDSPNLPANEEALQRRISRSTEAFTRGGPPHPDREYQLVLVDDSDRLVGSAAILSKHGTSESPHLFLRVQNERRVSESAEVSMDHRTLRLGAEIDGPSELGALVLDPDTRGQPGWPGKLLSWGRFAYIALHPEAFEDRLMAEMRATFDDEGRNAFWQAFGARFTGMTYEEADRRSIHDKAFILDLFPSTPFYASVLDDEAIAELGQVHPDTRAALALLERAGFYWIGEIDPFDAGPFVGAATDEVIPIRDTRRLRLAAGAPNDDASAWIVSSEEGGAFRAVASRAEIEDDVVRLDKEARKRLGVADGDDVHLTPLPLRKETTHG